MNERIKQLAKQAKIDYDLRPEIARVPVWISTDEELAKFAELIVNQCAGIVEEYGLSLIGSDENYLGETLNLSIKVQEAGNKIKQHFGVKL
jgi:hypothetical protein